MVVVGEENVMLFDVRLNRKDALVGLGWKIGVDALVLVQRHIALLNIMFLCELIFCISWGWYPPSSCN